MSQNGAVRSSNGTTVRPASVDRRALRRNRVLKGARVIYNGGLGVAEAAVYDLSADGARLRFGETGVLPPNCKVEIKGVEGRRAARVVWRSPTQAGIRFEQAVALPPREFARYFT
jgi:hypothetical protein